MGRTDEFRVVDVAVDGDDLDRLRGRSRDGQGAIEVDPAGRPVRVKKREMRPDDVLQKLLDEDSLSIDEGPAERVQKKIAANPAGLKKGYDPYESGLLAKKERRRKRDLRALSAWIEARKRAESVKE
jgi:hypothetical protein